MSEQATGWIDARERKPEGTVDVVAIIEWQDVATRVYGEADKTGFREVLRDEPFGRSCAWSCVRYWLPLPPEPDSPDERKQALEEVFGGEWEQDVMSERAYWRGTMTSVVGVNEVAVTVGDAKVCVGHHNAERPDARAALETARDRLAETRDQLDDLLGPDGLDTVAHPSEHLREWCEAQDGRWRDAVNVKHWKDVEFVLAGGSVDHRDVAHGIAEATGTVMGSWLNLQRKYDEVHK